MVVCMTKGLFKRSVNRSVAGNVAVFIFVLLMACFMLLPIVYAVGSAFKPLDEIYIFPPRMLPHRPTLDNFLQLSLLTGTADSARYIRGEADGRTRFEALATLSPLPDPKEGLV